MIDSVYVGITSEWVPREQRMRKGHLPRVLPSPPNPFHGTPTNVNYYLRIPVYWVIYDSG